MNWASGNIVYESITDKCYMTFNAYQGKKLDAIAFKTRHDGELIDNLPSETKIADTNKALLFLKEYYDLNGFMENVKLIVDDCAKNVAKRDLRYVHEIDAVGSYHIIGNATFMIDKTHGINYCKIHDKPASHITIAKYWQNDVSRSFITSYKRDSHIFMIFTENKKNTYLVIDNYVSRAFIISDTYGICLIYGYHSAYFSSNSKVYLRSFDLCRFIDNNPDNAYILLRMAKKYFILQSEYVNIKELYPKDEEEIIFKNMEELDPSYNQEVQEYKAGIPLCVICKEDPSVLMIDVCGHLAYCASCSRHDKVKKRCAVCNKPYPNMEFIRVYVP